MLNLPMLNLPILHPRMPKIFGLCDGRQRLARNTRLAAAAHSQHSLEFVREDLDEAGKHFGPVIENPLGAAASGKFQMTGDEISYDLRILRAFYRFKVDRAQIASLFREITALIKTRKRPPPLMPAANSFRKIPARAPARLSCTHNRDRRLLRRLPSLPSCEPQSVLRPLH